MTMVTKAAARRRPPATVKAGEFKAHCLRLIDEVAATGAELVITKRGEPVARLSPIRRRPATLRGCLKGSMEIVGDIVAPTGERWNADS